MATPIFDALAQASLFLDTLGRHSGLRSLLDASGYSQSLHDAGKKAVHDAQEALDSVAHELQDDKIPGHLVHTAVAELEMWQETARARARKALGDDPRLPILMGDHVHGPSHTATAMARALRFESSLRLDADLRDLFGGARSAEDLLQRGKALLRKLNRLAEDDAHPAKTDADGLLRAPSAALRAWLDKAQPIAARALAGRPDELGLLGFVPADLGAPLGGTAFNVTRHAQTRREAPVGGPSDPDPSWSVGRQGRNREDVGKGYIHE